MSDFLLALLLPAVWDLLHSCLRYVSDHRKRQYLSSSRHPRGWRRIRLWTSPGFGAICALMIDLLLPLTGFALVTTVTPGPNNVMLTASGLNFGFRRSGPHMLGICFGFPAMVLLVGWGMAGLFTTSALLHQTLRVLGTAYLVYLAYRIATAPPVAVEGESRSRPMRFWEAVAFQWVNPKAWVMAVSAATSYTTLHGDNFREVAVIGAVFFLVSFPSAALWTSFGLVIRRWLSDPRHIRALNLAMAMALLASILPLLRE
jgi:threonine/homoserine/homoserine lactone efflux protein